MNNPLKIQKGLIINSSGSLAFDIQGISGQLFSVNDSLSGSLMSVNDISGIPIFEVFSDDTIKMGTFASEGFIVSGSSVKVQSKNSSVPATHIPIFASNPSSSAQTVQQRTPIQLLSDMGIIVSGSAPASPTIGDIWIDIS
jgi:hypothetical protein